MSPDLRTVPVAAETRLEDGWTAVGVEPGATDQRLGGLESSMLRLHVPGTAARALLDAGRSAEGLDDQDWWFRCRFASTPEAKGEQTSLRLEGIATLADVWLNGVHVLASESMHLAHEVPVGGLLRTENELVIGVRALGRVISGTRPRPRWRTRLVPTQNLRAVRTSLFGRIPAFAPGPAPVGPWRAVSLVRRTAVAVEQLTIRARLAGPDGVVRVRGAYRPLDVEPAGGTVRVTGMGVDLTGPIELRDGTFDGTVVVPAPERWWPHTHGMPALYRVEVTLEGREGPTRLRRASIGFRELRASDSPGLELSLNGEPLFCRGGTLLPERVALDRPADELRRILERVRDAGMNMVRLSGVGVYATEDLLALCDELGLLVWQDFPFANLDYPTDEAFLALVAREAGGFLAGAGAHPSLVVLCGSSEIEQQVAMLGLDPQLGRGPLFAEHLPRLVEELEVDAHYVPSTPTGGSPPFRPDTGVAHYFGVGAYRRPLEDARRAEVRFAAECLAFANVPDDTLLEELGTRDCHSAAWKAGVPRDSGAGWDFDDVRDHYLRELFDVDPMALRAVDTERYLSLSRVVTGEVMAQTLGEWRRARSTCRGALLWTLNDVLPGAGWGILDSAGRPKAAYWFVRRALAPVAVWMTDEGTNGIAVHAANDSAEQLDCELAVELFRRDGVLVEHGVVPLALTPRSTAETSVEEVLGRFVDAGHAYRFGPREIDVVVVELRHGSRLLSRAFHHPGGLAGAAMLTDDVGLEANVTPNGREPLTVVVGARRLAYGVVVEAPGFSLSDNVFTVPPGRSHTLMLSPLDGTASPGAVRLRALSTRAVAALRTS